MTDYKPVQDALEAGADPAMLCTTCPWDRHCLTPPSMTSAEVKQRMDEYSARDEEAAAKAIAAGRQPGMPQGIMIAALTFGGRDTMAQICPVLALRLRSSGGRQIADDLKASMQQWDDQQ